MQQTERTTETAPKEPSAPEPVDVDKLVEKMWQAARSCPEVVWGKSSILAALRVAAEALGQTERLWPRKKTPGERVTISQLQDFPSCLIRLDGKDVKTEPNLVDAVRYRRGLIAELEEGQSK